MRRYSRNGAKVIGTCPECRRDVYGPPMAKFRGLLKNPCKKCREYDPEAEAERRYFEKFDGGYQTDVQGFISSP